MSETSTKKEFKPYVPSSSSVAEFTIKSVLLGAIFGVIFGAATVYLALKAGLTVSASIPIAVLAISIGRKFFKTTLYKPLGQPENLLLPELFSPYLAFFFYQPEVTVNHSSLIGQYFSLLL